MSDNLGRPIFTYFNNTGSFWLLVSQLSKPFGWQEELSPNGQARTDRPPLPSPEVRRQDFCIRGPTNRTAERRGGTTPPHPTSTLHTHIAHQLLKHMHHLSPRFTSTAGWKSAPRKPTALSSAPSYVSAIVSAFTAAAVLVRSAQNCASPPPASEVGQQRRRRATTSETEKVQLVSVGPLLMGHTGSQVKETLCVKQKKSERRRFFSHGGRGGTLGIIWLSCLCSSVFQLAVYMLSGVAVGLLLILIITAWRSFRKPKQDDDAQECSDQSQ